MKYIKSISLLLFFLIIQACTDPVPTELINDEYDGDDGYQIEVLSPEPEQNVYANGYDSTGIVKPVTNIASFVYINHIKNSSDNNVQYYSSASAVFYDTTKAIRNSQGKIVGFKAKYLGRVSFNGDTASVVPFIIRTKQSGANKDTLAGFKYYLFRRSNAPIGSYFLPYGSVVDFTIKTFLTERKFKLPVPQEITGNVTASGKAINKNLRVRLNWNGLPKGKIDIIIGGVYKANPGLFPLLKVTTRDDGNFEIPKSILDKIRFDKFDYLVFTFLRQNTALRFDNLTGTIHFAAQSIHNIVFDIR